MKPAHFLPSNEHIKGGTTVVHINILGWRAQVLEICVVTGGASHVLKVGTIHLLMV